MRDGEDAPGWSASRGLRRFWFPFDTPGARAHALVHGSGRIPQARRVRRRLRDRRRVTDPSPLLDRAGIEKAFRRLGDRLAKRSVVADCTCSVVLRWPLPTIPAGLPVMSTRCSSPHGIVHEEALAVAAKLGLPRWWLNEQASSYVAPGGDPAATFPEEEPPERLRLLLEDIFPEKDDQSPGRV